MSTSTTVTVADPSSATSSTTFASAAPGRPKQLVELWHPWVSRFWPSTAREEAAFVADLQSHVSAQGADAGTPRDFDRRDVTALVTALRCGLTVDELLSRARGLRPRRLLAAHGHLDTARATGAEAWEAIVRTPTSAAVAHFGPVAATLLPVIIGHIEAIDRRSPHDLERGIRTADAEISRTTQSVVLLEERLDACAAPSDRGRAIGSLLYDAYGDGAWSLGTFLPPRVGTLVPLRVASLLGEDTPGRLRQAS